MRKLHVMVVPFVQKKGGLHLDQTLAARSPEVGIATANRIAHLYAGVGVFGIWVDDVTGDASDLHELLSLGQVPHVHELVEAA